MSNEIGCAIRQRKEATIGEDATPCPAGQEVKEVEDVGRHLPHVETRHLPRWLLPSVLRQWSLGVHYMNSPSMAYSLRHPAQLPKALRLRWPNPIQATVGIGGPFNELPRLPFQLAECLLRSGYFVTQIPRLIRQKSPHAVGRGDHGPVAA